MIRTTSCEWFSSAGYESAGFSLHGVGAELPRPHTVTKRLHILCSLPINPRFATILTSGGITRRDIVPLGSRKANFNYSLDTKRVLNMENLVVDSDNIKQVGVPLRRPAHSVIGGSRKENARASILHDAHLHVVTLALGCSISVSPSPSPRPSGMMEFSLSAGHVH